MKQKDIALILIVVVVSGVLSLFVSRALFNAPKDRQVQAEIVDAISTEFTRPSEKYFNSSSIDLTQEISIGEGSNGSPFSGQ